LGYAAGFIFGPIGLLALARLYPKKRF
jgi:hypothetical protein